MGRYLVIFTALISAVVAAFVFAPAAKAEGSAQNIEAANKYFNDRLYSKAVEAYKPFLESKNSNLRYEAELKTAISYYGQNKFDAALKQIYSYKVPSNNLWKARYYILKYALLNTGRYQSPDTQESLTDPTKFTADQIKEAKKETLLKLWDMRRKLADIPYEDIKPYNLTNQYPYIQQPAQYPTLFDAMIPLWQDNQIKSKAELYEQAYKIKGEGRATAVELWHIARVNLIGTDSPVINELNANWMQYISGMTDTYTEGYDIKKYIFRAQETLAKAKAAYMAAVSYNDLQKYEEAVETLDYCISLELNVVTDACKDLKKDITEPYVELGNNNNNAEPNKEYNLQVYTRNLDKFYIHIFPLNPGLLKDRYGLYSFNTNDLKLNKPARTLGISVAYDKPYAVHTSNIVLPKEKSGFYAIVLSESKEYDKYANSYGKELIVNFTDIAIAGTAYGKAKNLAAQISAGNFFNVYTLDAKTGAPKQGVKLDANISAKPVFTGKDGQGFIVQPKKNNKALNLLASRNGNYAILNNLWFSKSEKSKYLMAVNTDMSIYKAGAPIKAQITAAEFKGAAGYLLAEGKNVKITLRGPNYNTLETKTLKLDNMGSAEYKYTTSKDAMLGNYTLQAELDGTYYSANVSVEAFKTPEFEVSLKENKEPVKFGKPFEVEGNAKYYYGLATANAKVSYKIEKSNFFPIFWRTAKIFSGTELVKEGRTTTDKNGNFKLTFTPEYTDKIKAEPAMPSKYTVKVFVTDKAGNTIQASSDYIVSAKEKFFDIQMAKGFFRQATQNAVEIKMMNVNGEALEGKATARIYMAQTPKEWNNNQDLTKQLKKDKLVRIDPVDFKAGEPAQLMVPPLKEGWYILELTAQGEEKASDNDTISFMVVNAEKPALDIPQNTTILENKTYYPGEKASVLIASPKAKGNKYVEIYKDEFLVTKQVLSQPGAVIMQLPVSAAYQGGISLNWFSVYDYQFFQGNTNIEIPYVNSKLKLELSGTEVSLPGAKKTVSLTVVDDKNVPVDARALVTVYDSALDYYRPHKLNSIQAYNNSFGYNPVQTSLNNLQGPIALEMAMDMAAGATPRSANMMLATNMKAASRSYSSYMADERGAEADANIVDFRSDFATNALWLPSLDIKNGFSEFTFTLPQSVGRWNILAAAFTKNVKTGKTEFNFLTKKDLMINLEAPRFLRNGDQIELQALVSNTTDKPMSAEVKLTVNHSCDDAVGSCELIEFPAKNIMLPAKGQNIVKWPFTAPENGSDIMFSASAKSAVLSDGEIKTVPLLPSLQQLTSSRTVALKKGTNKLFLGGVDANAKIEAVHLTISPSLLMPVLNAMPLLTKASPTLATYVADSYLPLSIFNKLYNDYPQLKEAAAKLPKRGSVMPAWNINEELLLNDIAQSPWYLLAKGYNQKDAVINLFNAETVAAQKEQAEKDLAKFQNKDGGYAWVKGGQSNIFITLNVLESFAQAYRYGVKIDENTAKKALNYIVSKYDGKDVNIGVYMAYVLTAFPKEWNAKAYQAAQKAMAEFEKNILQTPLAYAYAATVYKRLGNNDKAKLQIERLFDMSNTSEITGIDWTVEARTWQWFEDGITLHAAAIQALSEFDPSDPRINGLVKWLIFNEKAQAWGSPQSAAKAVYALMGIMIKDNVLEQTKIFTTEWNDKTSKVTVEPYDIDPSGLTLSAYEGDITPAVFKASINKAILTMEKPAEDIDDYATITALFTTATPEAASKGGLINVAKDYYLIKDGKASKLKEGDALSAGDEVQVRLTLKSQSAFDFVVVSDPKPAAFEDDQLLSGWKYDNQISRYEELKANVTNFFIQSLPNGTYELKYTIRPSSAGVFTSGAAVAQSMFMPEVTAHSAGFKVKVK